MTSSQIFVKVTWSMSFIEIGQELWKCEAVTDRQTDTHTYTQTHTHTHTHTLRQTNRHRGSIATTMLRQKQEH